MRARLTAALIMLLLLATASPAGADTASGGGWIEDDTPVASVSTPGGPAGARQVNDPGGGSDARGTGPRCSYERVPEGETLREPDGSDREKPEEGAWYVERCFGPDGREVSYGVVFVPAGGGPGGEQVDPEVLARRLLERLPLAGPAVATSPPPERDQLVNLATWLWVDDGWEPLTATASLPGVSVTVTAAPQRVEWAMGTGDRVVCAGPGTAYDHGRREEDQSTDCSYTYRRSSAGEPGERFGVTATTTWRVSWTAIGVSGGGDLGEVSRSTVFSLRVAEGQALTTGGG